MFDDLRRNFLMNPSSGLKVKCKTSGGTCLEGLFKVVLFEISTRPRTSSLMKCSFSLVCGQGSGFVGNLKIFVFKNSRKNLPEHPVDRKMLNPTSK